MNSLILQCDVVCEKHHVRSGFSLSVIRLCFMVIHNWIATLIIQGVDFVAGEKRDMFSWDKTKHKSSFQFSHCL